MVYDTDVGCYCFVTLLEGRFLSTGVRIGKAVPRGIRRHLKESAEARNARFLRRHEELRPQERARSGHAMRTLGPEGGLLEGRRFTEGAVRGLTILVEFDDVVSEFDRRDFMLPRFGRRRVGVRFRRRKQRPSHSHTWSCA